MLVYIFFLFDFSDSLPYARKKIASRGEGLIAPVPKIFFYAFTCLPAMEQIAFSVSVVRNVSKDFTIVSTSRGVYRIFPGGGENSTRSKNK